jgi:signal transduction histidine kinase
MDVRSVVQTTVNTFRALAFSKQLQYHMRVDPAMPATIRGDDTRLQQILGNLIGTHIQTEKERQSESE